MPEQKEQEQERTAPVAAPATVDPVPLTAVQEPQGSLSMQDALVALVDHAGEPSSPQQPFIIPDITPLQGEITTASLNVNINPPPLEQQDNQAAGPVCRLHLSYITSNFNFIYSSYTFLSSLFLSPFHSLFLFPTFPPIFIRKHANTD